MVASLWLRCVERFQEGFLRALDNPNPIAGALAGARHIVTWSQQNTDDARLLLAHHRRDLLADGWPSEIADRNQAQVQLASAAMADLRLALGADADCERVEFAVLTVPMGAVRPALSRGVAPSSQIEDLTVEAVWALLQKFA